MRAAAFRAEPAFFSRVTATLCVISLAVQVLVTYKYSATRSHTDGFQRNNAKCLDEKGISRFVPHSSI